MNIVNLAGYLSTSEDRVSEFLRIGESRAISSISDALRDKLLSCGIVESFGEKFIVVRNRYDEVRSILANRGFVDR